MSLLWLLAYGRCWGKSHSLMRVETLTWYIVTKGGIIPINNLYTHSWGGIENTFLERDWQQSGQLLFV